jgi:hypothetical protein
LVEDGAIPFESEGFEGSQDVVGCAWDGAGRVEIFNSDKPFAIVGAGLAVAGKGGY